MTTTRGLVVKLDCWAEVRQDVTHRKLRPGGSTWLYRASRWAGLGGAKVVLLEPWNPAGNLRAEPRPVQGWNSGLVVHVVRGPKLGRGKVDLQLDGGWRKSSLAWDSLGR